MKKIGILFALSLLVSACANNTTVRQHQDYASLANDISSVVIVPADVDIELIAFDGDNEELSEDEQAIRQEIESMAQKRLAEEGLTVVDFDFATEMANDEEFAYAVTQCKEAWTAAKNEMYTAGLVSEDKKSDFQTSLGPVANSILEKTGAESILLMHYQGAKKSAGMIAKDAGISILVGVLTAGAVVPIQATEGASIDVALVETAGGRVVWANRKALGAVDSNIATLALAELPDVEWENEIAAQKAQDTLAADQTQVDASAEATEAKAE